MKYACNKCLEVIRDFELKNCLKVVVRRSAAAGAQAEMMTINVPILDMDRLDSNFEFAKTMHIDKVRMNAHLYGRWGGEQEDAE